MTEGCLLRVLLVSSSSGSKGGGELYLVNLAEGLKSLGHVVEALLSNHPRMDALARLLQPWAKVHRERYTNTYDRPLRTLGAVLDRPLIRRLRNRLRGLQPDVIHVNKQNLEDGLDLILAATRSSLPLVSTVHITRDPASLRALAGPLRRLDCAVRAPPHANAMPGNRPRLRRPIDNPVGRCHPAVTHPLRDQRRSRAPPGDRAAIRREWQCNDRDVVLGCLARIEHQKDPLFLVGLLPDLPEQVRLVWLGDGSLRDELLETARRLGVRDRVRVEGWRSDARARLAGFDLFALPSRYEGLPLALLEAMAAGLPCVASAVDGTREAIVDGESGYFCPPNDREAWLSRLRALMANESQRGAVGPIGAKAVSRVLQPGSNGQGNGERLSGSHIGLQT